GGKWEERLREGRQGMGASGLTEAATLLTRWAVGQLAGYGGKFIRLRQKLRQRPFGAAADFRDRRRRRDLEQDMACVDQIPAPEPLQVSVIVTPAFRPCRRRHHDLLRQQALDGGADLV